MKKILYQIISTWVHSDTTHTITTVTSDLNARIVHDPSIVSVNDVYIGERETLSSLRNSRDVDL